VNKNELIVKIAHLYYMENMDLKEIGKVFNLSYATISRLLKKGREQGLIRVIIKSNFNKRVFLESEIKKKLNLKEVFSISILKNYSYNYVLFLIGREVAEYISNLINDGDVLGTSWGRTIFNVVEQLDNFKIDNKKIDVVQLIGNINIPIQLNSADLVRRITSLFSGSYHFINSEAFLDNKKVKNEILKIASIKKTLSLHKKINISLVGVGIFNPSMNDFLYRDFMKINEIKELEARNVVGEINFSFFDIEGNIIRGKFNERVICIETADMLNIDNKILVAAGIRKAPAILGAIRAGLVDILFIDDKTLENIYEMIH